VEGWKWEAELVIDTFGDSKFGIFLLVHPNTV
jgi:hypothetical protein